MNISTFTKITCLACAILSVITLGMVGGMNVSINQERQYHQRQMEFRQLGNDLANASDFLTREARRYSIFGKQKHYDAYWNEVNITRTRDLVVKRLKQLQATDEEMRLIKTAKKNSDALIATEKAAMEAVQQGDLLRAQTLMFDENYDRNKAIIMEPIKKFQQITNSRAEDEALTARQQAAKMQTQTNLAIVVFVLSAFSMFYFALPRKICRPLTSITQAIEQIATDKMIATIPYVDKQNEIGRLARSAQFFQANYLEKEALAGDLARHRDSLKSEIERKIHHLQVANTELEEFTYRISHDLLSPLVSSTRLLELTQESIDEDDKESAAESLAFARKSLKKLDNLLQDIRILRETENNTEENQFVCISELLKEVFTKLKNLPDFNLIEFQLDLQFDSPLFTKQTHFQRIIENLVSNAIKYRDSKKERSFIHVLTKIAGDQFFLEVSDNGLGIPEDQRPRLFTMFKRFHPKVSFGSGLGLYIIKKSVVALDGNISYKDLGEGSRFRLNFPLQRELCPTSIQESV